MKNSAVYMLYKNIGSVVDSIEKGRGPSILKGFYSVVRRAYQMSLLYGRIVSAVLASFIHMYVAGLSKKRNEINRKKEEKIHRRVSHR